MKTIAFDLDDVICWHHSDYDRLGIGKYRHCEPIDNGVELVNEYKTGEFADQFQIGNQQVQFGLERVNI